ncbi:arylamine N-acetyltransferase [Oceanobacter antarcticus]|uniref:Arylamine N-acetyltransferase n=1 Tax=Oceanobacter antarcticus TaxID=3133425 RepID=A0ABW8NLR8_9GAMM
MSAPRRATSSLEAAEALLLHHFRTQPFHNLNLLYNNGKPLGLPGGTCSDKALSYLTDARKLGFDAHLHTAFMGGQEIHRLARLHIDGETYFADVGNGWPAIKLIPASRNIEYSCFGMRYRTEVDGDWVKVFHKRQGKESLQMEIKLQPSREEDILEDIKARYSSGIKYPFSNSVRFSAIVDNSFLFLRGESLQLYGAEHFQVVDGLSAESIPEVLKNHFGHSYPAPVPSAT